MNSTSLACDSLRCLLAVLYSNIAASYSLLRQYTIPVISYGKACDVSLLSVACVSELHAQKIRGPSVPFLNNVLPGIIIDLPVTDK